MEHTLQCADFYLNKSISLIVWLWNKNEFGYRNNVCCERKQTSHMYLIHQGITDKFQGFGQNLSTVKMKRTLTIKVVSNSLLCKDNQPPMQFRFAQHMPTLARHDHHHHILYLVRNPADPIKDIVWVSGLHKYCQLYGVVKLSLP